MNKIYLSNQLEVLYDHLKNNFISKHSSFFSKKTLVVPHRKVSSWVALRLATEEGIASGFKILSLKEATGPLPLPEETDLAFILRKKIRDIAELAAYVGDNERKLSLLALHLASLFHRYLFYGGSEKLVGWQKTLWQSLEHSSTSHFEGEFHLFGFNHLSPFHFDLFQKRNATLYTLSPCQEFWSDILEKKTALKMGKREPELLSYLDDVHPLLANLGKIGRLWAKQIEESSLETIESYVTVEESTALHRLQNTLLSLGSHTDVEDDSVQVHAYMTKKDEIDGLFAYLYPLLLTKKVEPKEIVVCAPNISDYLPFIEVAFSTLPFKVQDLEDEKSTLFLKLLALEKKRWAPPWVFDVVRMQKVFTEDELDLLESWIEKTSIRWGYSLSHAIAILKKRIPETSFCDPRATWEFGLNSLFTSLATSEQISFKEAPLLGKFALHLEALYTELREFHDGTQKTVSAWNEKILRLSGLECSSFFSGNEPLSFSALFPFIEKGISRLKRNLHGHLIQAITFCSHQCVTPAKVMCLIGMDEEGFPRREKWRTLDLLNNSPLLQDFDKYAFLEGVLSARDFFYVSFRGRSPFDHTPLSPSTVVSALGKKEITQHFKFQGLGKSKRKAVISAFVPVKIDIPQLKQVLTLQDLLQAIKNPLRPYFQKKLKIFLKRNPTESEEDVFKLSPLQKAMIRKTSLRQPPETVLNRVKKEGPFPLSLFNEICVRQVEQELDDLQLPQTTSIEINRWCGNTLLYGKIEGVTGEIFYTPDSCSFESAIRQFPLFVLSGAKEWVFARDKKRKSRFFEDADSLLRLYVEYYYMCQETPTPFFPEWIPSLLEGDEKKLKKVMGEETFHEELQFVMMQGSPEIDLMLWQKQAKQLYGALKDAWF